MNSRRCPYTWKSPHPVREVRGHNPESWGIVTLTVQDRPSLAWKNRCTEVVQEVAPGRKVEPREIEEERHREDFINHTDTRFNKRLIRDRVEEALRGDEWELERRRARLRCLLAEEDVGNLVEVQKDEERAEDRMREMRDRLEKLRCRKEEERVSLVQQKLHQQFVLMNDNYRTEQSRQLTEKVAQDRLAQMEENALRRELEREEDRMWGELLCGDMRARAGREERDVKELIEKENHVTCVLKEQLEEREKKIEREKEKKKEEEILLLHRMSLIDDERKEEERERVEGMLELRKIYQQNMRDHQEALKRDRLEEDVCDLGYLGCVLESLSAQKESRVQRKREDLKEMRQYRDYVRRDREETEREEREFERLCGEEIEKENKKRDEELRKRREISKDLIKQCAESHLKNRKSREEWVMKVAEEKKKAVKARLVRAEEEERLEEEERRDERRRKGEYGEDLTNQHKYNEKLREEERAERERMIEKGKETEKELKKKVEELTEGFSIQKLHPTLHRVMEKEGALPELKMKQPEPLLNRDKTINPCKYMGSEDHSEPSYCNKILDHTS